MREYEALIEAFLEDMREVEGTSQDEFLEGLMYALSEIEIEIQATKETM